MSSHEPDRAREREGILFKHFDVPNRQRIEVYEELGGYRALRKALTEMSADQVLRELDGSGLRGRGGAGFALGKKASFLPHGEIEKYLCCNADESEPGAFKDRELMHRNPHQLIEGMMITAYAAGIRHAFIYIRGEYLEQAELLEGAIAEALERGYTGDDILGSGFSCGLVLHRGAGAYICGEETALLDSLEGKRGNPRLKPPFPANRGLFQGPTLINNVETLSNVPQIVEHGAEWFRSFGTERSPGTKIVSVSGNVQRPGNYEVELGVPARHIIFDLAGGPPPGRRVKCWFPGGSSAPVLTEQHLDLPYDFEHMAEAGSMLGSGSIIVVDDSVPIVSVALRLAEFYRHESCGKCVPCREGTNWTVKMLERIDRGEATPIDLDVMDSVQDNIVGNCLCVLGDSMALPIASMIGHFRPEFEQHMEEAALRSGGPLTLDEARPEAGRVEGIEGEPHASRAHEERGAVGAGGESA
jgi:NADH-quinone oxidoreductase subunit F